ncbi:MAG TPA: ABC transporter permease [Anaerolineae bacterium]|jgi:hypothetical protein
MTHLAFRNLVQQKFRLALSISGVALAMMLIVLLNGFLAGIYVQVTAYLDHTPVDLIVAQDGVANLLSATSLLPPNADDLAGSVPGVAQLVPIVSQFVILDIHDQKVVAYMVGYGGSASFFRISTCCRPYRPWIMSASSPSWPASRAASPGSGLRNFWSNWVWAIA